MPLFAVFSDSRAPQQERLVRAIRKNRPLSKPGECVTVIMAYREPDRGIEGNRLTPGPTGVINSNLILIANHRDWIRSKFVERSISPQPQYGLPANIQDAKQVLSVQIDVGEE